MFSCCNLFNFTNRQALLTLFMDQNQGRYIILFGVIILIVGLIIYFFGNKLSWVGHLPGDIRVEKENFKFYFPITTMILISVLLTLIINITRRWL